MGLDQYVVKTERETIKDFRKINFLQGYFHRKYPDNDLNCKYVRITKEMAEDILAKCKAILDSIETHSNETLEETIKLAEETLPIEKGFFYGDYVYNQFYFEDVQEVHDFFEFLLKEYDLEKDTIEYSSWY